MAVSKKTRLAQERLQRQRKRQQKSILTWVGISVGLLAILAFVLLNVNSEPLGEHIPIPPGSETHIPTGSQPGPYTSNPPAGGVHYGGTYQAGFYQEADVASLPQYPEGYLVHNLEHGYVIFWYNCQELDEANCTELKTQIQRVMNEFNGVKLIAFPWASLDVPVAMTSWGRLLKLDSFSPEIAREFVRNNRNKAPEPQGQ